MNARRLPLRTPTTASGTLALLKTASGTLALLKTASGTLALLLVLGCATPHAPTRVAERSTAAVGIEAASGYVYDELLSDTGVTLDEGGRITAVTPDWARKALGRVLDLQEALDNCEAERRALIR